MGGKKCINVRTILKILSAVATLFKIFKRCMGQRLQVWAISITALNYLFAMSPTVLKIFKRYGLQSLKNGMSKKLF